MYLALGTEPLRAGVQCPQCAQMSRQSRRSSLVKTLKFIFARISACELGPSACFGTRWMPWADSRAAPCIDNITYQDIAVTTLMGKEPFCVASSRDPFFGLLFACFLHVLPFRISPYHGRRIGEASHPGPLTITFCATNPTAIHGKSQRICELGANFVFAAETSATEAAQYVENPNFYDHGFKVLWGHPVASQKGEHIEHGSYRGKSMGVAAITNLPVRPVREPFLDLWKTCRFHETWIHIGGFNVLCLTVYAFPEPVNQPDKNRILLNALLERATSTAGCVLIGGDFNTMLYPDEHSDLVRARGFVDILQLARHKWPAKCPPTCAGATFNDTILVKGPILEHLSRAWVSTPLSFGIHSPFFAEFVFPTETFSYQKWLLPRDWSELSPDPERIIQQYESTPFQHTHDPDADLLQWAAKVELSVGLSLPESADATRLPSRYGGRCQPPAFTRVQPPCVPKPANSSHFEPPSDVATFKACHTVRQTRRLQTFLRSHRAFMAEATEARTANVHKEWSAICRAKSFAPNFRRWCLSTLGSFPVDIYSVTPQWLSLAIHECRSYADTYHRKMSILRQQEFVEKLQVDWKEHGGSFTCKLLKPPAQPPLDIVTFTEDCAATRLRAFNKGQHRLKLHADLDLVPGDEIVVSGHRCEVQNAKGRIIQVDHLGEDTPVRCVIKYEKWCQNSGQILDSLQKVWLPFWQRDRAEEQWDESHWAEAREFTNTFCPQSPTAFAERVTLPEWLAAVKKTAPSSAKGSCGLHRAHEDLLEILHDITLGSAWPTVLTTARTVFLRKSEHDLSPHTTRPITVFALIYRAWAKAWVSKALRQLALVAPKTLAGGLPNTSTSTVWWWLQEKLEQLQFHKRQAFGFNLDLLKCFNLMGRACVTMMLTHFGVPHQIATAWLRAMMQSTRVLQIAHQHSLPVPSTTGVPEGDPVGVLAMALLGATWVRAIESVDAHGFAYADNLEFLASDFDKAEKALDMSVVFAEAFRHVISYPKSWGYSTDTAGQKTWQKYVAALPPSERFAVKKTANDLGAAVYYRGHKDASLQKKRHMAAEARLAKAAALPLPKIAKKQIVRHAFAMAFHACEISLPSQARLLSMRRSVACFILSRKGSANPWLACAFGTDCHLDPLYHVAIQVFRMLRHVCFKDPDAFARVWNHAIYLKQPQYLRLRENAQGPGATLARLTDHLQFPERDSLFHRWMRSPFSPASWWDFGDVFRSHLDHPNPCPNFRHQKMGKGPTHRSL